MAAPSCLRPRMHCAVTSVAKLYRAEHELHAQRLSWLRVESVHRVLREIVQETRFSKASSALTAEDKFYSTLEQCLMVAQCVKQMEVSSDSSEDHSGVLGLTAERVQRQMPPEQELVEMKQRLSSELLQHLKKKAVGILTYYQPERENESEGLRSVKLSKLPELLDAEQKRAESLTEKNRENVTLLQRQTHTNLSVSPEKHIHVCKTPNSHFMQDTTNSVKIC
ncbi:HAUS augmin-like complex subunit 4 [Onychostoma macrolepis]|uniref:HAUS augmin-like complex subunit 4 n=1 Tax=Onychostoma macrolepis TaxID=369639 RepID=UPI00272A97A4|nr:HAUS augmin-like complex subunit 4 [Onychostoma macrolepis]